MMRAAVIGERNETVRRRPIDFELLTGPFFAGYGNLVTGRTVAVENLEARPGVRNHRIHRERVAANFQTERLFDPDAIHPSRRARVPGPAAAADSPRRIVDIRGHCVGLTAIAGHVFETAATLHRAHDLEQPDGGFA